VQNSPSQESAAVPLAGVVCFSVFLLFFYRTRVGMKDHTSAKNWHMGLWEKLCKCLGIFRLWGKGKRSVTVKQHTAVLSPGPLAYWPLIPEIGIYNLFWTTLEKVFFQESWIFCPLAFQEEPLTKQPEWKTPNQLNKEGHHQLPPSPSYLSWGGQRSRESNYLKV
jgi:hypothetical protein